MCAGRVTELEHAASLVARQRRVAAGAFARETSADDRPHVSGQPGSPKLELAFKPEEIGRRSWFFLWPRTAPVGGPNRTLFEPDFADLRRTTPADVSHTPGEAPSPPSPPSPPSTVELLLAASDPKPVQLPLVVREGRNTAPSTRDCRRIELSAAIEILSTVGADGDQPHSVQAWADAVRSGLRAILEHGVVPSISPTGFDVWKLGRAATEVPALRRAADAMPASGLSYSEDAVHLFEPHAAVLALWNAMADHLTRSPVSERLSASHVYAGHAPTRVDHLRTWTTRLATDGVPTEPLELSVSMDDDRSPAGADSSPTFTVTARLIDPTTDAPLALLRSLRRLAPIWDPAAALARVGVERLTSPEPSASDNRAEITLDELDIAALIEIEPELRRQGSEVAWPQHLATAALTIEVVPETEGASSPDHEPTMWARPSVDIEAAIPTRWRLRLNGDTLTSAETDAVRRSPTSLLQLRGRWVAIPPSIRSALNGAPDPLSVGALAGRLLDTADRDAASIESATIEPIGTAETGADPSAHSDPSCPEGRERDAHTLRPDSQLLGEGEHGEHLPAVRADGRWELFLEGLRSLVQPSEGATPEGLQAELRPYQRSGVHWLETLVRLGVGGCLADDMGLGKTVQVIAAHRADLDRRRREATSAEVGPVTAPTLIVCPTSLIGNWERELRRFSPDTRVVKVTSSAHAEELRSSGAVTTRVLGPDAAVLVTYGTLRRCADALAGPVWQIVVCDEAQHIKNHRSATARSVRELRSRCRVALTGTPIENRVTDLWAIMDWALPGLLGHHEQFRRTFALPIERDGSSFATRRLGTTIAPFLLRREKSDERVALDLPEKMERAHSVKLTPEQRSLYQEVTERELGTIRGTEGFARRGRVLALLTALKQVCNHPAHYEKLDGPLPRRSEKFDLAVRLVEDASNRGEHSLVFTHFVAMARLLHQQFSATGLRSKILDGSLSAPARQTLIDEFQAGELDVLILSLRAGGTGLTLTRASQVVHFDRWWNPAVEDQASDRAHRIGQRRTVTVHTLTCRGTLEERIAEMLDEKRRLARSLIGRNDDWLGELTDEDLEGLIRLSSEEVDRDLGPEPASPEGPATGEAPAGTGAHLDQKVRSA